MDKHISRSDGVKSNGQTNGQHFSGLDTTSSRFEITKGSLVFPFVLGFGIEGFDSIEIGTFNWGQLSYLEFAVLFAGFIHRLLMADRAGPLSNASPVEERIMSSCRT